MHLLFFLANKQADDHFQALGYQQHKQEFCTGAASPSSNTDAQLAWHVLRLLRYVVLLPVRRHVAAPRNLPPLNMACDESDNNERQVDGLA